MPATKPDTKLLVQARLPEDLVKDIDHLSIEWNLFRAQAMERLLREAIDNYKKLGSLWSLRTNAGSPEPRLFPSRRSAQGKDNATYRDPDRA